jgi:hypothetical protein
MVVITILASIALIITLVFVTHTSNEPELATVACLVLLFLTSLLALTIVTDGTVVNVCEENGIYEVTYITMNGSKVHKFTGTLEEMNEHKYLEIDEVIGFNGIEND